MKQIPIKWTAPEALNFGKYNALCDVWSYAVLIWEIFSKGATPYAGMSNSRAREKIDEGKKIKLLLINLFIYLFISIKRLSNADARRNPSRNVQINVKMLG